MDEIRDRNSSFLASLPCIIINPAAAVLFAYYKKSTLAIVFMVLFVLGLAARLWAKAAGKKLICDFSYSSLGLFPGERLDINLYIRNKKFLPVLWMAVRDGLCEEYAVPALLWHEEVSVQKSWVADRRGIKRLDRRCILTGDGFGLSEMFVDDSNIRGNDVLAVYPERVRVNCRPFMKNLWNASTGKNGSIEDVTVIRSTRDYERSDDARHINWRLASRNLPLAVNVYENIQPRGVHFIFDGESFAEHEEPLEEALSVLGSLLIELDENGFASGMSICMGKDCNAESFAAGEPVADMLFALAAYNNLDPKWDDAGEKIHQESEFDDEAVLALQGSVGHFYYLCYDAAVAGRSKLLGKLPPESVSLLTYEEGGELWLENIPMRTLRL